MVTWAAYSRCVFERYFNPIPPNFGICLDATYMQPSVVFSFIPWNNKTVKDFLLKIIVLNMQKKKLDWLLGPGPGGWYSILMYLCVFVL